MNTVVFEMVHESLRLAHEAMSSVPVGTEAMQEKLDAVRNQLEAACATLKEVLAGEGQCH